MEHGKALNRAARIWGFDGGGPSVISQLLIIDEIMHQIQWRLKLEQVPRPCDYAELMVGTELGALIAILLARLQLTARQALEHTVKFGQHAFTEPNKSTTGHKYDADQLIAAIRALLSECGLAEDAKMVVKSDQTYVAVTAVPTSDLSTCRLLRTYQAPGLNHDYSIFEVIVATMSNPEWFPSVKLDHGHFKEELVGGSVGFNNPAKKALEEAERIFGSERQVSVFISFGSGQPRPYSLTKQNTEKLQQVMSTMAQEGGSIADDLAQRFRDTSFYYRFSVDSGAGLCEVTRWSEGELGGIDSHTRTYLERVSSSVTSVMEMLVRNEGSHTIGQIARVKTTALAAKAVPRLSPYYVERDDVYDFMNRRLIHNDRDGQKLFIINGMGGAGKTQLASFFARKNRNRYRYTFFIDASSVESIKADLQSAIRSVSGAHSQDTYTDALGFLAHHDNRDWLAIFDNADDPKLPFAMYLPECDHGTVIITGRNRALTELAPTSHWNLQGMDESDSTDVLFKAARREGSRAEGEMKAATELCKLLGGLPLALVHVGSYCHMTVTPFLQYLERFKTHRAKLMAMEPPLQLDKYSYSTYTSIGLSYTLLDDPARGLLHLLTFFHPSSICLDILRTASKYEFRMNMEWEVSPRNDQHDDRVNALTQLLMSDGSWSDIHMDILLKQLQTLSLVSLSHSNDQTNITIHPLIQSCIRDTLSSVDHSLYFHMVVLVLRSCSRREEAALFQHLPTHIAELESCEEEMHPNELAGLAYIVFVNGNYAEALRKYEKVKDECRKMNGEEDRSTLRMTFRIARCLYGMHKYEEVEAMVRGVAKTQETVLGEDDDDTIESYQLLANTLRGQKKTKEAETILNRLLTLSEDKNGQEHRRTLDIQWSLGANLFDQGRYSEAEVMSRKGLIVMKKLLGEDDDITLFTLDTLSRALIAQRKWAEAEYILNEQIAKKKRKYGRHHPRTLISLFKFALCLIEREELDEAESILREILEVREKILGKNHQYTINARERLEYVNRQKQIRHLTHISPPILPNSSPPAACISDRNFSSKPMKNTVQLDRTRELASRNSPIPKRRSARLEGIRKSVRPK